MAIDWNSRLGNWRAAASICALAAILPLMGKGEGQQGRVAARPRSSARHEARALAVFGKLPIAFEPNVGQWDHRFDYVARGAGYQASLKADGIQLSLPNLHARSIGGAAAARGVRLRMEGANLNAVPAAEQMMSGHTSYFYGSTPAHWRRNLPNYARVRYSSVYPGIDVVYYGRQGKLEYDFEVAPHANPETIRLTCDGAGAPSIDQDQSLVLAGAQGLIKQEQPVGYQMINGQRRPVSVRYALNDKHEVRLQMGRYDTTRPLIIDPALSYSTYLGGDGTDQALGVAVDRFGSAYVVGTTNSGDFPTSTGLALPPVPSRIGGRDDIFIIKLNPTGDDVEYAAYIGGKGLDIGQAIAIDALGDAYLTGSTTSSDFPAMSGAGLSHTLRGPRDAFLLKLNSAGNDLVFSGLLGGTGQELGMGIALDQHQNAYLIGSTDSNDFPTSAGAAQGKLLGAASAFVTEVAADGGSVMYSTYLGASSTTLGAGIAVDALGNAYVTGSTGSGLTTTLSAPQQIYGGGASDAFLARVSASGGSFDYVTYLGGNGADEGRAVAVDAFGDAYVTGGTASLNYPTRGPIMQMPNNAATDVFVTKVSAAGDELIYSTYLGGAGADVGNAIALDSAGAAVVAGGTTSADFPVKNALHGLRGPKDAFVTRLLPDGSGLSYSTFLGGTGSDEAKGVALDTDGNAYVTGITSSLDFDLVPSQPLRTNTGALDAFITKLPSQLQPPSQPTSLTATGLELAVALAWSDNSNDETGFEVQRKDASSDFATIKTLAANKTTFTDTGLAPNSSYQYRVRAIVPGGASQYSDAASATTFPIAAPDGLTATPLPATPDSAVVLSWTDRSNAEMTYEVQRKTSTGDYISVSTAVAGVAAPAPNTVAFTDTNLAPSTLYVYRVRALTPSGSSGFSAPAQVTTLPLGSPSNLTVTASSDTQIDVSFQDQTNDETGFELYRRIGAGDFALLKTLPASNGMAVVNYSDVGLTPGTLYSYRVRTLGPTTNSTSDFSAVASALTPPLFVPDKLTSGGSSETEIQLSWEDHNADEAGFELQRRTGAGDFALLKTLPPSSVTGVKYVDTGLSPGVAYQYRVRAIGTAPGSFSDFSGVLTAATTTVQSPQLKVPVATDTEVTLKWIDNSSVESGFEVQRRIASGDFALVKVMPAQPGTGGEVTYVDSGLTPGTLYSYRVRAVGPVAGTFSEYSAVQTLTTTQVAGPSALHVDHVMANEVDLSWANPNGLNTNLDVQRKTGSGDYVSIATLPAVGGKSASTFPDKSVAPNTAYSYRVRAIGPGTYSQFSNEVAATTDFAKLDDKSWSVSPGRLSFESQLLASGGRPRTKGVLITNSGSLPLVISTSLADRNAQFDAPANGLVVAPNSRATLQVTFRANRYGTFSAVLTVYAANSNGERGPKTVKLQGKTKHQHGSAH